MAAIDADSAQCEGNDRAIIFPHIASHYGSIARFNAVLRLRLLLQPIMYDRDIKALTARSADVFDFEPLAGSLAAAGGSACLAVCADSGEVRE